MFRREKRVPLLADWLSHERWLSDRVVLLSDGSVCAAFEVDGVAFETVDAATINRRTREMNGTWRNVRSDRLTITRKLHHGLADDSVLPEVPGGPGSELLRAYYRNLSDLCLYRNRQFLFLEWHPTSMPTEWLTEAAANRGPDAEESVEDRVANLERACGLLQEQLREYGLRRIGMVERSGEFGCNGVFNEIAEAEALCLTGVWRPVPVVTGRIGDSMLSEDVTFHHEHIEIRGPGHTVYAAHLAMKDYPVRTWAGMLNGMLQADFGYTLVQSFRFLEQSQAEARLSRRQNRATWIGDRAADQIAALSRAISELADGEFVLGLHNLTLCVFADRQRPIPGMPALPDVVNSAWRLLGSMQCVVARENKALMAAWLSMVAGNSKYQVRPGAIASRNDVALNPLFSFPIGPETSRGGGPILITRTSGGTPHRLHWHDGVGNSATGNTYITGETGSGKTSAVGLLTAATVINFRRAGGGWIGLDHKRGWKALTYALGGSYMELGDGEPNFAPLKALDNTTRNREFVLALMRACIRRGDWRDLTPEEDRLLHLGVETVMGLDPEDRSVGEVQAFLGDDPEGAGARLRKWCWGEELGWVIDAPADRIDMSGDVNCFDTTRLLANVQARDPAIAYLFHRVELRLDGRPLLITADEGWHLMTIEEVEAQVNKSIRTMRSKGGNLVLISQDPSDGTKSRIAAALVGQCPNQIHFPNARARREHYVDGLKMTEAEHAALKRLRKGSGKFLLRKGPDSSVQQIPMHGMDDWLAVVSAGETDLNAIDLIPEDVRRDPDRFLVEYHRLRRGMAREREFAR